MTVDARTDQLIEQYQHFRMEVWRRMRPMMSQLVDELDYTDDQAWSMVRGMEQDVVRPLHVQYLGEMARARGMIP